MLEKVCMMIVTGANTYHAVMGRTCPAAPRDRSIAQYSSTIWFHDDGVMGSSSQKSAPTSTPRS
jgi:hypothetical protein